MTNKKIYKNKGENRMKKSTKNIQGKTIRKNNKNIDYEKRSYYLAIIVFVVGTVFDLLIYYK
ncbi:TPA: hypothetical protein ACMU2U_001425 [Clostridioides difficile]|nr:hypothetical protein [Clostridioides difficile]MCI4304781.1 hypothetical protein [Clostridioides difficile]MCM4101585.1 hypothetical protein [Clostridioides difficile]HBG2405031.1 hypothetical protein [Clostridioides difficile]HDF4164015.1 hypothetical protein [Clostridioides difficile]